jgi:hypothetical protein
VARRVVAAEWVMSESLAHPALVSEEDFVAVQHVRAARVCEDGRVRQHLLVGLLGCGLCGRLMDAHWVNGRAGYRCRHGHTGARPAPPDRVKKLYVREDTLVAGLVRRLKVDGDGSVLTASEVIERLRSDATVIVHNRNGWSLTARNDS